MRVLLALVGLMLVVAMPVAASPCSVTNNVNGDLVFDKADPLYLLAYLFQGGPRPICSNQTDANGDGRVDIADAIAMFNQLACSNAILGDVNGSGGVALADVDYLLDYMFTGGPAPVPCLATGDINGDGNLTIGDASALLNALPCPSSVPGDANGDETVNLADALLVTQYLFNGGPAPVPCPLAGDINQDGALNIADVSFYFSYLF